MRVPRTMGRPDTLPGTCSISSHCVQSISEAVFILAMVGALFLQVIATPYCMLLWCVCHSPGTWANAALWTTSTQEEKACCANDPSRKRRCHCSSLPNNAQPAFRDLIRRVTAPDTGPRSRTRQPVVIGLSRADHGDQLAAKALETMAHYLGRGMRMIV